MSDSQEFPSIEGFKELLRVTHGNIGFEEYGLLVNKWGSLGTFHLVMYLHKKVEMLMSKCSQLSKDLQRSESMNATKGTINYCPKCQKIYKEGVN